MLKPLRPMAKTGLGLLGSVSRGALLAAALAVGLMALVRRSFWIVLVAVESIR